ncbi:MAG: restriction endonuclease subunit S [Clostridiales bacterium]|nr:restriction endonuclease subunit S [Clostridiales bacterium]
MTSLSNNDVYRDLLERLEISIIPLRDINENLRFEAEHFQRKYHRLFATMNTLDCRPIKELIASPVHTGSTPSMKEPRYYEGGVYPLIKTDNLRENAVVGEFTDHLTQQGYDKLKNVHLQPDDIIVTIIGATYDVIGRCALVRTNILPATINQNIALIRPDRRQIVPEYFVTYLNSRYGRLYLEYLSRQANQVNLNCREIEEVLVPLFSLDFQGKIGNIVRAAYEKLTSAENIYRDADRLLMQELGLSEFTPSREQISVRSFKDIMQTGRIDAEYYQPKYDDLADKMKLFSHDTVESGCNVYEVDFKPDKNAKYKYIELANIGTFGEINSCTYDFGSELPSRARRIVHSGNIIISSIEGSLQSCAIITDDYDGALCSTGFYVIDSDKINSETLLVLFKSAPMQVLLKQQCTGTILTAFSRDGLLTIPLPNVSADLQDKVKSCITESFIYRSTSTNLLTMAKHAVEIAIEQSEAAAINYLSNHLK